MPIQSPVHFECMMPLCTMKRLYSTSFFLIKCAFSTSYSRFNLPNHISYINITVGLYLPKNVKFLSSAIWLYINLFRIIIMLHEFIFSLMTARHLSLLQNNPIPHELLFYWDVFFCSGMFLIWYYTVSDVCDTFFHLANLHYIWHLWFSMLLKNRQIYVIYSKGPLILIPHYKI